MIRILSDLHLAHPASLITDVSQVEPLLEGARSVVFNGDTAELRLKRFRSRSLQCLETLRGLCLVREIEPVFINGNHDPEVSLIDHIELMSGRLLVTHGHVLFPEITPWSRTAKSLLENHTRVLEEMSNGGELEMEDRLLAVRKACLRSPADKGKTAETPLQWMAAALSEMAHPFRAYEVLRAWAVSPALAADFAARNRPEAECVILGHTHRPGSWKRGERLVVNTGAYLPWFGRRMVDVFEDHLLVRAVDRKREHFYPGKELFRWAPKKANLAQPTLIRSHPPKKDLRPEDKTFRTSRSE